METRWIVGFDWATAGTHKAMRQPSAAGKYMAILNFLSMGLGLSNCTIPTNEGAPAVGISTQGRSAVPGRISDLPAAAPCLQLEESAGYRAGFFAGCFPGSPAGFSWVRSRKPP